MLEERRFFPKEKKTHEIFGKGRPSELKDHILFEGSRILTFYVDCRVDGMVKRELLFGKKIVERFEGRDDHMIYRSATFVQSVEVLLKDELN